LWKTVKPFVPFSRRALKTNAPLTLAATGSSASMLLFGGSPTYAAFRQACRFLAMMRLSALISPNHGMPDRKKPNRCDGWNTLALGVPPLVEYAYVHSNVLGSLH